MFYSCLKQTLIDGLKAVQSTEAPVHLDAGAIRRDNELRIQGEGQQSGFQLSFGVLSTLKFKLNYSKLTGLINYFIIKKINLVFLIIEVESCDM